MNIDMAALTTIEKDKGIPVDDMLQTIGSALIHAYRDYRGEEESTESRVDIDKDTGSVQIIVTELDEDGAMTSEYDDTPDNFARLAAGAVRDAIVKRLREAENVRLFDEYQAFALSDAELKTEVDELLAEQ